jgi:hypothetical protein
MKRIICSEICDLNCRYNPEIFFQGLRITTKQTFATKWMRIALFWAVTLLAVAIPYPRFGRTYRSHLYGPRIIKTGPTVCPVVAVRNCHSMNKYSTRCNCILVFIQETLHVSGVHMPIIRSNLTAQAAVRIKKICAGS